MTDLVVADCGIRQLFALYIDAVWRQDAEEFAACWTANGEWKIAGLHMRGRSEIADGCRKLIGRCERVQLVTMPPILEVGEGTAIGRHHMIEFTKMRDGSTTMNIGVYHDRFAEEDGRWRFRHRHWSMKYRGDADLSAAFIDTPDYGPFPNMPADDEPTWVRPV